MTRRRSTIGSRLMNERICLPGAPQIVVTRAWAFDWLRQTLGYPVHTGGFGSADYSAFSGPSTDEPLTDLNEPWARSLLAAVEAG